MATPSYECQIHLRTHYLENLNITKRKVHNYVRHYPIRISTCPQEFIFVDIKYITYDKLWEDIGPVSVAMKIYFTD